MHFPLQFQICIEMHKNRPLKNGKQQLWAKYELISTVVHRLVPCISRLFKQTAPENYFSPNMLFSFMTQQLLCKYQVTSIPWYISVFAFRPFLLFKNNNNKARSIETQKINNMALAERRRKLAVTAVSWGAFQWYQAWAQPSAPQARSPGAAHEWSLHSPLPNPTRSAGPVHLIKDVKNNAGGENTVMAISNVAFHLLGPKTAPISHVLSVMCLHK